MNTEFVLVIASAVATGLLTVEGLWVLVTTRDRKLAKPMMTTPAYGERKRICIIFPTYKDVVDLDKWLEWSKGEPVKYIIAEDITNNSLKYKDKATIIHRDVRDGFKAGAVNNVFNYLVSKKEDFDYILIFDSDHLPYNDSIKEIYGYLNKEVIQFFWLDGLPLKTPLNWLTFSSRYYSNWNIYNRIFPNLTGSGIAIRYDLVKEDNVRFPETITEDYALTLRTIHSRRLKVTVIPYVISIGSSPKSFRGFVKQQTRWAEGTIRDGTTYFWKVMESDSISTSGKLDFLLHVNMYMQGIWTIFTVVLLVSGFGYSLYMIPILLFQAIAYMKTLGKTPKKYWILYFFLNYYMATVQLYAFLRAILIKHGTFHVTDKVTLPSGQMTPRLNLQ